MPNVPHLLPTSEAARRLGVHVRTIHRWVESGRLVPAARAPGIRGALLFSEDDVDRAAAQDAA